MTSNVQRLLRSMQQSGDSQQIAVADGVLGIASNGDGQERNSFLYTCAEEIQEAGGSVMRLSRPRKPTPDRMREQRLNIVKRVWAYEEERRRKGDHHVHDEERDEWKAMIAKAEGRK